MYESVATNQAANSSGISCNAPSGLAAGDLMVMAVTIDADGGNNTVNAKTGWSNLDDTADAITGVTNTGGGALYMQYRVADSADVAAGSFSWTFGGSTGGSGYIIAIFRFSSMSTNTVYNSGTAGTTSATYTNGITPHSANNIFLMVTAGTNSAGSGSVSGYAVATDDPTWTERVDIFQSSTFDTIDDMLLAAATATRTAATATGNSSLTTVNFPDTVCILLSIAPTTSGNAFFMGANF